MQSRGIRNNNPGNIREAPGDKTKWKGERVTDDDPAFEEFVTIEDGIRALFITLRTYIHVHKRSNIRTIISRWAPPEDHNDTEAYIRVVCKRSKIKELEDVSFNWEQISEIVRAMCFMETGAKITDEQLEKAWSMV